MVVGLIDTVDGDVRAWISEVVNMVDLTVVMNV